MKLDIQKEHAIETYKSLIQVSVEGMKMLAILNGGASVSLLAYLGNVAGKGHPVPDMRLPMGFFVGGLVCCGLTLLCSYLTQLRLFNESMGRVNGSILSRHKLWLNCGISMAFFSITAFACGAFLAVAKFA